MFYIHGGGFSTGSGDGAMLDGTYLAKYGDVVVVTVNHRLNVFGYTNLAHLHRDFADAANAGQLDLVAALEWVKTNIGAFGGEPQNVTAFGESGGGAKIVALSVMPDANGLFHRSINMSGSGAFSLKPAVAAEPLTNELLKVLGIDVANVRKLQEIPAEQLLAAHATAMANLKSDQSRPVVDGRYIFHAPMSPEGIALQASIPGIMSRTATEATPWLVADRRNLQVTAEQLSTRLKAQYGLDDAQAAAVSKGYRQDDPNRTPWDVLVAAASEALVRSPMRHAAEARSRAGAAPVYLCDFDWKSSVEGGIWGAPHAIDIPFAFGTLDQNRMTAGSDAGAIEASRNLMSAYVAFSRTGIPNDRRTPQWKPYDIATRPTMVFDKMSRLVNDFRSGDRRTSDRLSQQPTFQLMSGPLFRFSA